MSQYKEITKEEAKQRYICSQRVYLSNERRTLWEMTPAGYYGSHAPLEELFYRTIPWGEGESTFYKPLLTDKQKEHQQTINAKNGWGLTDSMMWNLYNKHKAARKAGDEVRMAEIEYRLTDANFHSFCSKLSTGDYKLARKEIKERYK